MKSVGIGLDIDGVLLLGGKIIDCAPKALQLLAQNNIPHVFVTNGGGCHEHKKAKDLSKKLHCHVSPDQILLSHTPMKKLVEKFENSRILVLGHEGCIEVAEAYGFKKVSTAIDVLKEVPIIYPGHRSLDSTPARYAGEPFAAALIIHDPLDWALEMQVLTDILLNGQNYLHPIENVPMEQTIPFYSCNADLVYKTEYARPRYTQGAFVEAFGHLFERFTKSKLHVEFYGKPFAVQYRQAEEMIEKQALALGVDIPQYFYGIGDNPVSDIRGANNAGHHWSSILVRTGIFQGDNSGDDVADVVFDNVLEAVEYIIKENQ